MAGNDRTCLFVGYELAPSQKLAPPTTPHPAGEMQPLHGAPLLPSAPLCRGHGAQFLAMMRPPPPPRRLIPARPAQVCTIEVQLVETTRERCWDENAKTVGMGLGTNFHGCVGYNHNAGTANRQLDFSHAVFRKVSISLLPTT